MEEGLYLVIGMQQLKWDIDLVMFVDHKKITFLILNLLLKIANLKLA